MNPPREKLEPRVAAQQVAQRLVEAGFRAYFAGGCVRDRLLGRQPEDYDIATDARPEQIQAVFPKARGVGEAFGVMLVRHGGRTFEVATFRKDGPYHDGRRPSEVIFSDEIEDAKRRDFTVNGIFEDPVTGDPVDFVEGRADIEARLIRAIRNPHERIAEDRLRMLRAVRFAARLGFDIEPITSAAIRAHAAELRAVSPERVGEEVRKMLAHPARVRAAGLVESHGLDGAIFGDCAGLQAGAPSADCPRLAGLEAQADAIAALAAWQVDRLARRGAGEARPDATARERLVAGLRARLVLSNSETDALACILSAREALLSGHEARPLATRIRLYAALGFDAALAIVASEDRALADRVGAEAARELPDRRLPAPILDGNALIAEGLRAGPVFKILLDLAMDAQLERRIATRDEALALVREHGRTDRPVGP